MFKKISAAIGLSIVVIITVTLYRFGMFKNVDVSEKATPSKIIYGKYFEGDVQSDEFRNIFQEIGRITEAKEVDGKVCGMYFNNPENNKGVIKAFVGIWVADSTFTKKEEYVYYVIPSSEVIEAHLNADFRVATFKCYNAIFEYSEENNIAITEQFFEWFENKEEVYVQVIKL